MTRSEAPKPPRRPVNPGKRLWASVVADHDLDQHELALLLEAVRTVDLLKDLDAAVKRDGVLVDSPQGMKVHRPAVEA